MRFPNLPEPKLIEPDFNGDLSRLKNDYQHRTHYLPHSNAPESALLEQLAYERNLLIDDINDTGKQNLLAFARDEKLDNLGALLDTPRLKESSALVTMRLTLKRHHGFALPTTFEVRANDHKTFFSVRSTTNVAPGKSSVDIVFECKTPGPLGNGFAPGDIVDIVTPHDIVEGAVNIDASQGGSDKERDDDYAYRIWLAPSRFSTCGPYDAYRYFALEASPAITAVHVDNPAPNEVVIYPLLKGGQVPTDPIKQAILANVNSEKRMPMSDIVSVKAPTHVDGQLTMTIEVYSDYATMSKQIKDEANIALTKLLARWRDQLGRDIVLGALEAPVQSIQGVYMATGHVQIGGHPMSGRKHALNANEFPKLTLGALTMTVSQEISDEAPSQ
ncbi:baseplate J/gp47 family protein [Vibrio mediterranei]|uniref:baseplate J/gp47 family protein n=1 Tax=Vibrio mediterranei TaxID=689 RepID=UPI00228404AB|nr:baseplate J/gp47 family protein [Vibrio mediterranei]MCY9855823.1 baseplate J/gp47 family protein [Vibrio mediterranei]